MTLARAGHVGRVEHKADASPVTAADREVERLLRARLAELRPGEAVLGEEGGGAVDTGGGRRWLLDPIDGTVQYARGIPVWATMVGLEEAGRPVAGIVSAPALGRRWWGVRGRTSPWRVSEVASLREAAFATNRLWAAGDAMRARIDALAGRCAVAGGYESFLGAVMVAQGGLEAALLPEVEPWDVVPLQAVVEAAGGRCALIDCGARRIGALFTNARLHEAVLLALRG